MGNFCTGFPNLSVKMISVFVFRLCVYFSTICSIRSPLRYIIYGKRDILYGDTLIILQILNFYGTFHNSPTPRRP